MSRIVTNLRVCIFAGFWSASAGIFEEVIAMPFV